MCFTMIALELGLVFIKIAELRVFTGKSPKQPPSTTSSSKEDSLQVSCFGNAPRIVSLFAD